MSEAAEDLEEAAVKPIFGEPPQGVDGWVVWPSRFPPTYQITTIRNYWQNRPEAGRFPELPRDNLQATIERALARTGNSLPLYVVER